MRDNRPDLHYYKERVTSAPADKEAVERQELSVTKEDINELKRMLDEKDGS